ncbi:MAG: hypothetical protein ACI90V_010814 [Bacillariaceae sp.]
MFGNDVIDGKRQQSQDKNTGTQHSESETRTIMATNQVLLFLIVGKNEPLYEAEITKKGSSGNTDTSVARQSYFVVHSSLDLVDRATWSSQNVC